MKRAGVLVFATALAAACGEGVTAPGELRGTITLSATEIAPAQPVTVHLTLVNTGGRQVVFSLPLHFASDQAPIVVWPGERTAAAAARHIRELGACAGAARVPPPGDVTITLYVKTGGAVLGVGFGSDHPSPVHDAWADCAARTIGRWAFDDPGDHVVKASFRYRPKQP